MKLAEKVTAFVTGKNKTERLQERAANSNIKKLQQAAYYKEKESQAILIAQAKARAEAKQKILNINNQIKRSSQPYSSPFNSANLGSAFGMGGQSKATPSSFNPITGVWSSGVKRKIRRRKIYR